MLSQEDAGSQSSSLFFRVKEKNRHGTDQNTNTERVAISTLSESPQESRVQQNRLTIVDPTTHSSPSADRVFGLPRSHFLFIACVLFVLGVMVYYGMCCCFSSGAAAPVPWPDPLRPALPLLRMDRRELGVLKVGLLSSSAFCVCPCVPPATNAQTPWKHIIGLLPFRSQYPTPPQCLTQPDCQGRSLEYF